MSGTRMVALATIALVVLLRFGNTGQYQAQSPLYQVYVPIVVRDVKFYAWSLAWDDRIPMQLLTLDARQSRQFSCSAQEAARFAHDHPGQLYIACDEPDINTAAWKTPRDYAVWYRDYVMTIWEADPTARFSPAGFALASPGLHYTEYAQAFYDGYTFLYVEVPPVDEWRFHAFICDPTNIDWWKQKVSQASVWSVAHGAPMTLGSFGMPCSTPEVDITETMWAMHDAIVANPNIVSEVWWSNDWLNWPHALRLPDGSLSPEGKVYSQWQ